MSNAVSVILIILFVQYVDRNYLVHFGICIGLAVIAVVLIFIFIPESPEFLVARGDLEDY